MSPKSIPLLSVCLHVFVLFLRWSSTHNTLQTLTSTSWLLPSFTIREQRTLIGNQGDGSILAWRWSHFRLLRFLWVFCSSCLILSRLQTTNRLHSTCRKFSAVKPGALQSPSCERIHTWKTWRNIFLFSCSGAEEKLLRNPRLMRRAGRERSRGREEDGETDLLRVWVRTRLKQGMSNYHRNHKSLITYILVCFFIIILKKNQ